jgi:hypothetical protein
MCASQLLMTLSINIHHFFFPLVAVLLGRQSGSQSLLWHLKQRLGAYEGLPHGLPVAMRVWQTVLETGCSNPTPKEVQGGPASVLTWLSRLFKPTGISWLSSISCIKNLYRACNHIEHSTPRYWHLLVVESQYEARLDENDQ